ncbi:MAG: bacterial Ig-like protein [Paenibacillus sp.]|nr:bacterial Ig-like protein [Paenibacillus sp.]
MAWLLALSVWVVYPSVPAQAEMPSDDWPILQNANFENTAGGLPSSWSLLGGVAQSSSEQTHGGSLSVKLTDASSTDSTRLRSERMAVYPGSEYEASVVAYNTQGVSELYVELWTADNRLIKVSNAANTKLNEWSRIKISGTIPSETSYVTLRFHLGGANIGTTYFDDAAFVPIYSQVFPKLNNGDMERSIGGLPQYWSVISGTVESSGERAHSGLSSVKIIDSSSTISAGARSNKIAILPGQKAEASVFSYNTQGMSELYLEFWGADNKLVKILTWPNQTLDKWGPMQINTVAPEGTVYATVRFHLNSGNVGTAYFDDAVFRIIPDAPVVNLINGKFEMASNGKPIYWSEIGGTVEMSDNPVYLGQHSVRVTNPGTSSSSGIRSRIISVTEGTYYEAKVQAYAVTGVSVLKLEFWDANMVPLGRAAVQGTASNVWEGLTVSGITPAQSVFASLQLGMNGNQSGSGYFDEAEFKRVSPVTSSKTRTTYYTPAKVAAARHNVQTYGWAKNLRDTAVTKADKYLSKGLDFLWEAVPGQTMPRSYGVNQVLGSPVTGKEIDKFGNYPYKADPVQEPWKIVDPSSGYKFPTNDFGAYYRTGLDDHGVFRPELADRSLLVNTLYPEKGPGWGVDDGFGWVDEHGNRYTFIAYYVHWFSWLGTGLVDDALVTLRDAYLYTGDMKYARGGTILLDRVADLYPELDVSAFDKTIFLNSHGGRGQGKAVGSIWETTLAKTLVSAYDAFYPAMDDPELIQYLDAKSQQYKLTNGKTSGASIRRNVEDGIIRQIYPAVKSTQIYGNDGTHQSALAMAAVVYDTLPDTKEWLDFVFRTGGLETNPYRVTGGNILNSLVSNVDRNGNGNEGAPLYNELWLQAHRITADILEGYDLYPGVDLYQNPKFRKLFSGTYPLILIENYTAQIGDSGSTGNPGMIVKLPDMIQAFDKFDDPIFAQMAYFLNGNLADGLHEDVFSDQPEGIANRIRSVIQEQGPLNLKSESLSGYGFTALRDGVNVNRSFGLMFSFPWMEVVDKNSSYSLFPASGTLQFEALNPGGAITFQFQVSKTDEYEVELLPFQAPSYGIYRISIDGQPVQDMDFSGPRNEQYATLTRLTLSAGTHQISFECIGKNAASSNYKMGVRMLRLLDEQARVLRDSANSQESTLRDFWMYYGINSGHAHRDTLNMGVHAFGLDLSPDLGYPEFADGRDMHRAQWVINTISHNTVVVDQRKQGAQAIAELKHFDDSDLVKLIDVEAPDVYSQTELYKRTTAMIKVDEANSYAVDFFRVKGGNDHHFSFHGAEGTVAAEGLQLVDQPTGTYAGPNVEYGQRVDDVEGSAYMGSGFHYLKNVSRDLNPSSQFSLDWKVKDTWKVLPTPADIHLRLTMLGAVDDVALADGVPPQNKPGNPQSLRYMIAHRTGTNLESLFTSVIEPYKGNRYITSIEAVPVKTGNTVVADREAKAIKVTLANGRVDYIVQAMDSNMTYTIDGKIQFKGFIGVYSEQDGHEIYSYVHNGSFIGAIQEPAKETTGAVSGTLVDFTKTLSTHNEIVVSLDTTEIPANKLVDQTIIVEDGGHRNTAYRIKSVVHLGGDRYRLGIGDVTFIHAYVDPNDFSKGFVYDISEGMPIRIPLSQIGYGLETVASVSGTGSGGWYKGPVTVALSVYGDSRYLRSTEYSLDEGVTWTSYTTPLVWTDNVEHTVLYRSTDTAGNVEEAKSVSIRIDILPPVTEAIMVGTLGSGGWFKSPVEVTLHAIDSQSGVHTIQQALTVIESTYGQQGYAYQPYTGPNVLDEGKYELRFRATDAVGNTESEQRITLLIDRTPPIIQISGAGTYMVDEIVRITCTASDTVSGVTYSSCASPLVDSPAYVLGQGKHTVAAQAEDATGHVSHATAEYTVKVTLQSLINLIRQWITGPGADGLVNSLLTKLMLGQHEAFNNEVLAQKGVKLREEHADRLMLWVKAMNKD